MKLGSYTYLFLNFLLPDSSNLVISFIFDFAFDVFRNIIPGVLIIFLDAGHKLKFGTEVLVFLLLLFRWLVLQRQTAKKEKT